MGYYGRGSSWAPYVPVAKRREKALKHVQSLAKKGQAVNPIVINGRTIAQTFWGKAWCENLESYSDYANRLPRGRTYVRNGSVIDLQVTKGKINAQVMGSSLYHITIDVKQMPTNKWKTLVKDCSGKIDSLIELLKGKFSKAVMGIITQREGGLFPKPQEISMDCSCPDYAGMCKHIAAVLYGVGAALDTKPEWLFSLRHVDHWELVAAVHSGDAFVQVQPAEGALQDSELSALFDIELAGGKAPITIATAKPPAKATKKAATKIKR